jgi:ABC-type uncharacterized transport system permease subunit
MNWTNMTGGRGFIAIALVIFSRCSGRLPEPCFSALLLFHGASE